MVSGEVWEHLVINLLVYRRYAMRKNKRGRPRKYVNNSFLAMPDTLDYSEPTQLNVTENLVTNQATIDDWEGEVNDSQILPNLELSQSNDKADHQELYAEINLNLPQPVNQIFANTDLIATQKNPPDNHQQISNKFDTFIHIIDGEKGGCGKSFVCRAFIEYCNSIAYDMVIIDADTSNQDIAKIYPHVQTAFFSDDEKQAKQADKIFDLALEKSVLVNLPAQAYTNVTDWINRNDLVNLGKDNSISFVKWFVCNGGVDSVNFFLKSLSELGDNIVHVFVKNEGLCDDWSYIEEMGDFQEAANKYNFVVLNFPKFPFWERNMIERLEIPFSDALSHPDLKMVSKQRVKNFIKLTYEAFAATGLIR